MKFTLLWKDNELAKKNIEGWLKLGKSSDGITLIRVDNRDIVDKVTETFIQPALALRCKGSLFSYLNYKTTNKGAWIGWGDK